MSTRRRSFCRASWSLQRGAQGAAWEVAIPAPVAGVQTVALKLAATYLARESIL